MPGDESYLFTLADGREWIFSAEAGCADWLDTFATILGLEAGTPGGTASELRFIDRSPTPYERGDGWECQHLNPLRIWSHPERPFRYLECPGTGENSVNDAIMMSEAISCFNAIHFSSGALPLHATLLAKEGKAVAIAAPGGTGKSTCAARVPPPWTALADDMALVIRDGAMKFHAHPLPTWSEIFMHGNTGLRWEAGRHVPLEAIYFLEQADHDGATPLGEGEAAISTYASSIQISHIHLSRLDPAAARDARRHLFENACTFAENVPAFRLRATRHGRFWEEIERSMESPGGR
ncbi:SynChlorMet cassette protein ScmC [Methanofollis aquaemaris]|uniref:SynChlorMet cassette protein ScmC n=1 Tax=Methanofollis aquaemaris TaxID=126734 RepID=UPI00224066CE|nr:SynChlorMet cassette protein ScmC [Methanofollis aquaemaris]